MAWLNGELAQSRRRVGPAWQFRYEVVRVWKRPARDFLSGPLGVAPARYRWPISASRGLPAVVSRHARAHRRGSSTVRSSRSCGLQIYVLMGLRFERALIDNVLSGVMQMEESVTYQAILQGGVERGMEQGIQQGSLRKQ